MTVGGLVYKTVKGGFKKMDKVGWRSVIPFAKILKIKINLLAKNS
jgi:hypothetical protein